MISKKVLIPMAAVAFIGAGAYGVSKASAASSTQGGQGSLVQQIASTFHLDQSKVQAVFDQHRSDRQAQAETRYEAMLTNAVSDGKITSTQQNAILAEHSKLKSELDAASGKTGTDRRTALKQVRTEASAWATQNNVAARYLLGGRPLRGMGPMGHGNAATASPSPAD